MAHFRTPLRVLNATDDLSFSVDIPAAYRRAGAEVVVGTAPLLAGGGDFDIVHCHWPEELTGWRVPPSPAQVADVMHALERAKQRAFVVCTVHNLLPHEARPDDTATRDYYARFLGMMDAVGHFSRTSVQWVSEAFPEIESSRHFVHGMQLYTSLRAHAMSRSDARALLGMTEGETWVATLGAFRHAEELGLIHDAVRVVGSQSPRLLLAGRMPRSLTGVRHIWSRLGHTAWLRRHGVLSLGGYLPDRTVAAICQAADAMIILRSGHHLNSGLLPLATTFETPVVAPRYGTFAEFLSDSGNLLYSPGDPKSLADALRRVSRIDQTQVRAENRRRAEGWGCDNIVKSVIERFRGAVPRP